MIAISSGSGQSVFTHLLSSEQLNTGSQIILIHSERSAAGFRFMIDAIQQARHKGVNVSSYLFLTSKSSQNLTPQELAKTIGINEESLAIINEAYQSGSDLEQGFSEGREALRFVRGRRFNPSEDLQHILSAHQQRNLRLLRVFTCTNPSLRKQILAFCQTRGVECYSIDYE